MLLNTLLIIHILAAIAAFAANISYLYGHEWRSTIRQGELIR